LWLNIRRFERGRYLASFEEMVGAFLRAEKDVLYAPRWRSRTHGDYAEAVMPVAVADSRLLRGRVILAAHRVRQPPKYCFSVVFRNERVLALDVNPARIHRNLLVPAKVGSTHWQRWPYMEADADDRELPFNRWLNEFLRRANVKSRFPILSPPQGVQLDLAKWPRRR
jgi:hypothetical protein